MERSNRTTVYETVARHIVDTIEAGVGRFVLPWHRQGNGGMPMNALTNHAYHGVNAVLLWSVAQTRGYVRHLWATYPQWKELGAHVRRGETASPVVFYKPRGAHREASPEEHEPSPYVLRHSSVFNVAQVEGWEPPAFVCADVGRSILSADTFVQAIGANVIVGGDSAHYDSRRDRIHMPDVRTFTATRTSSATANYYAVLLHEHVHWTGHSTRLNRNLTGRFGTHAYAMEELVAELGAAFLCADIGLSVETREDHATYIAGWLGVLREQPTAIFGVAGTAGIACRYLVGLSKRTEQIECME